MRSTGRGNSEGGFSLIDIMMTVCVIGVVAAMALPISTGSISAERFRGDAQAIANLVGVVKMRAASRFSASRLRVDRTTNAYSLEIWDKTNEAWIVEGSVERISTGVQFGFGSLATPPPNTQDAIEFSRVCKAGVLPTSADIPNTACIIFNSRGIPVDSSGAPAGEHGVYLTDGSTGVYAITVTTTPLIRLWWSPAHNASWQELQ